MTTIRPEVLARIESYAPKKPDIRGNWPLIADTVRAAVRAAAPEHESDAMEWCSRAARFTNWAVRIAGADNTPAAVFTARNIDRFGDALRQEGLLQRNINPYLSRLRFLQRCMEGKSDRARPRPRGAVRPPYSRRELASHLSWARSRGTASLQETAVAVLALGAGAGLTNREIAMVTEGDLTFRPEGACVEVRGQRSRRVPLVRLWEAPLRELLRGQPDRRLVVVGADPSGLVRLGPLTQGRPPFNTYRLRTTWCVQVMKVLPAADFLHVAGLSSLSGLDHLLPYVDSGAEEDTARRLWAVTP